MPCCTPPARLALSSTATPAADRPGGTAGACRRLSGRPAVLPLRSFRESAGRETGRSAPGIARSLFDTLRNALQIKNYLQKLKKVDIVHSFARLGYLFFIMKSSLPKIQSYQRHITPRSIGLANWLAGKNITFTACSRYCAGTADFMGGKWQIIPNGVNLEQYDFNPQVSTDAPLVFLGRITRIKGVHTAIKVARKTNRRLLIAGNHAQSGSDYAYFRNEVLPHCDQKLIEYIGPVDDTGKNKLLSTAQALLFPVEWHEPFGIVMVEAFHSHPFLHPSHR